MWNLEWGRLAHGQAAKPQGGERPAHELALLRDDNQSFRLKTWVGVLPGDWWPDGPPIPGYIRRFPYRETE